jgi:hypothetical protein
MALVVLLASPGGATPGNGPDARVALVSRYARVVERGRICAAEDGEPPAAAAMPEAVVAALERREKEAASSGRPALPWLVAGAGALASGAVLALLAAWAAAPTSCRAPRCHRIDWGAGLERAAAFSLAGGAVATAVGVLVLVRPTPRRRVRVTADPGLASVTLSLRGEL